MRPMTLEGPASGVFYCALSPAPTDKDTGHDTHDVDHFRRRIAHLAARRSRLAICELTPQAHLPGPPKGDPGHSKTTSPPVPSGGLFCFRAASRGPSQNWRANANGRLDRDWPSRFRRRPKVSEDNEDARECWNDRTCGPWQDDADRRDHAGPGGSAARRWRSIRSTRLPRRKPAGSPSTPVMWSMSRTPVTTPTSIVRVTPIM